MGHDISGYNKEGKEIAYLRYNAFYESNDTIYKALNCCEFYGGYSGLGDGRIFSKTELVDALIYLSTNENCVGEKNFLTDCLDNLNSNNEVYISFG